MKIRLCSVSEIDTVKTFECGQCFRWNRDEDGAYTGVVGSFAASVSVEGNEVYITSNAPYEFWASYFDLERDYAAISEGFTGDYLRLCTEYGQGIRILRQDSWEALCSFIISQCNNITRIKGIVERLCESFGDAFEFEGRTYYSFPTAERLSELTAAELAPIRSGYRAEYIIVAAKAVADGSLDLEALKQMNYKDAIKEL